MVASFLHHLGSYIPLRKDGVQVRQRSKKSGEFDIRSFYNAQRGSTSISFFQKEIWGVKAPQGIFFCLDSSLGEDPCEKLMKRVYSLVSWYCTCQCSGETTKHLLIHCTMAYELWSFVFLSFWIHRVLTKRVIDLMFVWRN